MTTSKARARAQQGPRSAKKVDENGAQTRSSDHAEKTTARSDQRKRAGKKVATTRGSVRDAFHQPTSRDFVKKMTVEIDQDLHAELKMIAARQGVTIRAIVASQLERYVQENS